MSKYKEIELKNQVKYSITSRESKVNQNSFVKVKEPQRGQNMFGLNGFVNLLPDILKAQDFKELLDHTYNAYQNGKPIIVSLGGHIIKCGLAPLLIKMAELGVIKCFAGNGSISIHDYEIAINGNTSEDVGKAIDDGSFGMAKETGEGINEAIKRASKEGLGYGEGIGKALCSMNAKYKHLSLLASAYEMDIPVTIHVAVGTDIVHQHHNADGSAIGDCSLRDFRIFCQQIRELNDGGVFLNLGSAVVMPEVFLKAVTVVRNLKIPLDGFYTAVFDMIHHYRPQVNIVSRPTQRSGKGYYFIGHHEIMIPLFFQCLWERIVGC